MMDNLVDGNKIDLLLDVCGPVKDFTVQQMLEEGSVKVFGFAKQGYFRYSLKQQDEGLCLFFEKLPEEGITIHFSGLSEKIESARKIILHPKKENDFSISLERLSLGNNKSQDWSSIRKRCDLTEIFPIWLRLGQILPSMNGSYEVQGVFALLENCKSAIDHLRKDLIKQSFTDLYLAGFHSMMCPRLFDDEYQGIAPVSSAALPFSALHLLSQGSKMIRSLFFQENVDVYHLLPCLPAEFHSGRLIGIKTSSGDRIDFEWSKKMLKKVVITVARDKHLHLSLQKDIRAFRLKKSLSERGAAISVGSAITCKAGDVIYLDKFQK
jgi:hypothetical protein